MTKEQREIEEFEDIFGNVPFEDIKKIQKYIQKQIKEKDKDMKILKDNYENLITDISNIAKELGLEEDGTIDEIYAEIKKKDKIIGKINEISKNPYNELRVNGILFCGTDIKQYFERRVKNGFR